MRPTRIAALSVASNSLLVILKLFVGLLTGSVAVISEAIHSAMDLMASFIAYFSVRTSNQPPDRMHRYGHGKIENISGTIETLLIVVAGIWIIVESVNKINDPTPIRLPFLGIGIMVFGAIINLIIGRIIQRVGEETKSVAMKSNALHLLTDVYTSVGVAIGLLLVSLTGIHFLDPFIAICIALFIMREAYKLGKESFLPLVDTSLTDEEHQLIDRVMNRFADEYIEYHDLRTRRSGAEEHIDLHLVVPSDKSVAEAHDLCNRIESALQQAFPQAQTLIHIEPESEQGEENLPDP